MGIDERGFKPPYTRTRTSFNASRLPLTTWSQIHSGLGQVPESTSGSDTTSGLLGMKQGTDRIMTDVVVPGFKLRSARGEIFNHPLSIKTVEFLPNFGTMMHKATYSAPNNVPTCVRTHSGYLGSGFGSSSLSPGDFGPEMVRPLKIGLERLVSLASISANASVTKPETLSLVTFAEAHKTIDLITTAAKQIAAGIIAIRKGRPKAAVEAALGRKFKSAPVPKSVTDGVSRRWLEARYGWGPTLMDVSGTLQAIAKGEFQQPPRQTARGFQNHSESQEWVDTNWYKPVQTNHQGAYGFKYLQQDTVSIRAYILYTVAGRLQRIQDFGFTAFPSTAWELLPGSFIADWFSPIGDWISAFDPKIGVLQLASGYTVKRETVLQRIIHTYQNPPDTDGHNYRPIVSAIGHYDTVKVTTLDRVVPLPFPSLPPIDVKINVKRAVDAIALLQGVARSSLRT